MSTCGRPVVDVHSAPGAETFPRHDTAPVPSRDGGRETDVLRAQRQRIDMISPVIIRPKPTAKFHTPSDNMTGMRSPATQ